MIVRQATLALLLLAPLAGCGGEAPKAAEAPAPPASFPAGEWEVSSTTDSIRSADRSPPATTHKVGVTEVRRICSPPGPKPSLALFTDPGDKCTATLNYAKDGRLNMQSNCTRPGKGQLAVTLDGDFAADSFKAAVATGTYLTGSGDYVLAQTIRGKRLGDCAAGAPAAG